MVAYLYVKEANGNKERLPIKLVRRNESLSFIKALMLFTVQVDKDGVK